jgi:hypothetical protein
LAFPAAFYTAGAATAFGYFSSPPNAPQLPVIALDWGYAAGCMFAAVILIWLAVFFYFVDWLVRFIVWHPIHGFRRRNGAGEGDKQDVEASGDPASEEHDLTAFESATPIEHAPAVAVSEPVKPAETN